MNVTLRQLAYFQAVAETLHFGRAAEAMNVSQPALSVQIRELEAILGTQLVERNTREVVVTPFGHDVLQRVDKILADIADLEQAARWQSGLAGRLSLGVIPTIAPYLLPLLIPALKAENPDLDLRVRETLTDNLLSDLDQGRLDAIIIAVPSGRDDLIEAPLFKDRFLLAGSPEMLAHVKAKTETLRPSDLDPDCLLLLDEGHCLADQALEVCQLDRSKTRVQLGASSLGTLCGLTAEGCGMTFLPELSLEKERAARPDIAVMRFDAPEPARQIGLVRRALSRDDGWFSVLSEKINAAGQRIIDGLTV